MGSATEFSPGGCCCDVSGIFDLWIPFGTGNPNKFIRRTSLRPLGKPVLYDSDDAGAIDWFIQPPHSVNECGATSNGFPAFGKRVWNRQTRGSGTPEATSYLALYDTETRQELFSVNTLLFVAHGTNWAMGYFRTFDLSGVSQTMMAQYLPGNFGGPGTLLTCNDTGNLQSVSASLSFPTVSPTETVKMFAKRNWPDGIGTRVSGATTSLVRGAITVSGGFLRILTPQTVHTGTPGNTVSWMSYDSSPSHWTGVVREITPGFPTPLADISRLYIDGVLVKTLRQSTTYAPTNGPFGEVHVCHPHETLGDGWVAVPQLNWSVEPDAGNPGGNLVNTNRPWKIVFYKDGAQSWVMTEPWPNSRDIPPRVTASGDRWIYVDDMYRVGQSQGGLIRDHWKHDGSQPWRTGQLNGNTTIPDFGGIEGGFGTTTRLIPGDHTFTGYAVVQNSAALENALPLDFPPTT